MGKSKRKKSSKSNNKKKSSKNSQITINHKAEQNQIQIPEPYAYYRQNQDVDVDLDLRQYQVGNKIFNLIPLEIKVPGVPYLLKTYGKYLQVDEDEESQPPSPKNSKPKKSGSKAKAEESIKEETVIIENKSKSLKRKSSHLNELQKSIPQKQEASVSKKLQATHNVLPKTDEDYTRTSTEPEPETPPKLERRKPGPKSKKTESKLPPTSKPELPKRVCLNTDFIRNLIRRKPSTPKSQEPIASSDDDDRCDAPLSPANGPLLASLLVSDEANENKPKPNGSQGHQCKVCQKSFRSSAVLNMHHKKTHLAAPKPNIEPKIDLLEPVVAAKDICELCHKEFSSIASLNMHRKKAHSAGLSSGSKPSQQAVCNICKFSFLSMNSLSLHMKEIHRMKSPDIEEDKSLPKIIGVTGNAKLIPEPELPENDVIRYSCPYPQCRKEQLSYGTIEELKSHEDNIHKPKAPLQSYPCSNSRCSSIFTNPTSLKAHERLKHNVPQPKLSKFVCTGCDNLSFPSSECLERHNNLMHKQLQPPPIISVRPIPSAVENKFKCLVCSEDFGDSGLFRNHLLSHTRQFLTRSRRPGEGSGTITQYAGVSSTMSVGTPQSHTMEDSMSPPTTSVPSPSPSPLPIDNDDNDDDIQIIENPPTPVPQPAAIKTYANKNRALKKKSISRSSSDEFEGHEETGHNSNSKNQQSTFYCTSCWPRLSFATNLELITHNTNYHAPKSLPQQTQSQPVAVASPTVVPQIIQPSYSGVSVTPILTARTATTEPKARCQTNSKDKDVKKAIKCPFCPKKGFTAVRFLKSHITYKHKEMSQPHRKNLPDTSSSEPYIPHNMLDVGITSDDMIIQFDDQLLCPEAQDEQPIEINSSDFIIGTNFGDESELMSGEIEQNQSEVIIMDEFQPDTITITPNENQEADEDGNFTFNIVNHPPPDFAL